MHAAGLFRNQTLTFRPSGFKNFLNTRQTLSNITASNTAGVESTHSQLGAGLAD